MTLKKTQYLKLKFSLHGYLDFSLTRLIRPNFDEVEITRFDIEVDYEKVKETKTVLFLYVNMRKRNNTFGFAQGLLFWSTN